MSAKNHRSPKSPKLVPALVASLVVSALVAGGARAEDWPGFTAGLAQGAAARESVGRGFSGATWRHDLPDVQDALYHALVASPAAADGFVVFGSYDRRVRALRESDGQLLWETRASDSILASPTVAAGRVYVLATDGQLSALRLADGGVVWRRVLDSTGYGAVAVADGAAYVATGNPTPRLLRLDAETGDVTWTAGAGVLRQALHGSPVVADGHVIVGEMDGAWHAFSAATGALEWTAQTGGVVQMSSPLVVADRVYVVVGGATATVHAFALGTGAVVAGWPLTLTLPAESAPGAPLETRFATSSPAAAGPNRLAFVVRRSVALRAGGGAPDTLALREFVVGVDSGARVPGLAFATAGPALLTDEPNREPTFGLCATPAVFSDGAARVTLVVPSALEPRLALIDATSGVALETGEAPGVTRGSPLVANAGLVLVGDGGVVSRLAARDNRAPLAPARGFTPAAGVLLPTHDVRLSWGAASEPDGDGVTYRVRWDDDGEVLHDWDGELVTDADADAAAPSATPTNLVGERTYTWSVRARDAKGALSGWSAPQTFATFAPPDISIGAQRFDTLRDALAAARVGDTVTLGAGRLFLSGAATLPAGVTLAGSAPHLTIVDGRGADAAIVLGADTGSGLRGLTVTNARVGVRVDGGTHELRNVIVRDNVDAGVRVAGAATVGAINVTVARNGVGVDAAGTVALRNALVSRNRVGVLAAAGAAVVTRYSNIFANAEADRQLVETGPGDLTANVSFLDEAGGDLRLPAAQPTTDRGDPGDAFDQEPAPNGGRVNLGAFGDTPFAELSGRELGGGAAVGSDATPAATPSSDPAAKTSAAASGCGCALNGGSSGGARAVTLLLVAAVVARRRRARRGA